VTFGQRQRIRAGSKFSLQEIRARLTLSHYKKLGTGNNEI
jgi:hypothetical protein